MRAIGIAFFGLLIGTICAQAAGSPTYPYPGKHLTKPLVGLCFIDFDRTPKACGSLPLKAVRSSK